MRPGRITPLLLMIALIVGFSAQNVSAGFFSWFKDDDATQQAGNGESENRRCWCCPPDAPIRPIANAIGVRQQAGLPEDDSAELQSQTEQLDSRLEALERDLTRLTLIVEAILGKTEPDFQIPEAQPTESEGEGANNGSALRTEQPTRTIARPPAPPAELEIIR